MPWAKNQNLGPYSPHLLMGVLSDLPASFRVTLCHLLYDGGSVAFGLLRAEIPVPLPFLGEEGLSPHPRPGSTAGHPSTGPLELRV